MRHPPGKSHHGIDPGPGSQRIMDTPGTDRRFRHPGTHPHLSCVRRMRRRRLANTSPRLRITDQPAFRLHRPHRNPYGIDKRMPGRLTHEAIRRRRSTHSAPQEGSRPHPLLPATVVGSPTRTRLRPPPRHPKPTLTRQRPRPRLRTTA